MAPITELDGTPIEPLGVLLLTADEIDAIVAFLETLTDERVLFQCAPFDHPQLFVPNGISETPFGPLTQAATVLRTI